MRVPATIFRSCQPPGTARLGPPRIAQGTRATPCHVSLQVTPPATERQQRLPLFPDLESVHPGECCEKLRSSTGRKTTLAVLPIEGNGRYACSLADIIPAD